MFAFRSFVKDYKAGLIYPRENVIRIIIPKALSEKGGSDSTVKQRNSSER